jgi:hypothetical protein
MIAKRLYDPKTSKRRLLQNREPARTSYHGGDGHHSGTVGDSVGRITGIFGEAMKITIEENDKTKAKRILAVDDVFSLLWDIDQKCRDTIKYKPILNETEMALQEIRDMIWNENLLDLWE